MKAATRITRNSSSGRCVEKRGRFSIFGRVIALAALLFLTPLIVVIAIAVVAETGFPIFFSQTRIGKNGKSFRLYKFRKFHATESHRTRPVTLANDPRLTAVGRFIEKTKLDEVPQLWNVARGNMSFVGPRPEVPQFADCFVAGRCKVLDYTPGIFGPSQTMFRNEGELYPSSVDPETFYRLVLFPTKASIDLAYYPTRTLVRDAMWIVRGLLAVVGSNREPVPIGSGTMLAASAGSGSDD